MSKPSPARHFIIAFTLLALCAAAQAAEPSRIAQLLPSATVQLRDARSISVSGEGLIYIADTGHHRVIAIDDSGRLVAETGGLGSAHGQFRWPQTVVADRGNAVWVLDYGNRRIEKFSRSLEWQGTLNFSGSDAVLSGQPTALALSADGDVYVYDRDGGRIIRFDPLFRRQAELGSGGGAQFINDVIAMTVVRGRGVYWIERGGRAVRFADGLLNAASEGIRVRAASGTLLGSVDSCLVVGTADGVAAWCGARTAGDTLLSGDVLAQRLPQGMTALAIGADRALYTLHGKAGYVYRIGAP